MRKLVVAIAVAILAVLPVSANAAPIIPDASDWTITVTTLNDRSSPAAVTSVTDIIDGVDLSYSSATGGLNVGTSTRQYDYTTTAAATGILNYTVDLSSFTGFFGNEFSLAVLQNGAVAETLVAATNVEPGVNMLFSNLMLNLNTGDIWGIRAIAGNFDSDSDVMGTISVTAVPEPSSMILFGSGLLGLAAWRKYGKKNA